MGYYNYGEEGGCKIYCVKIEGSVQRYSTYIRKEEKACLEEV
jgi:hypothetical protein